MCTGTQYRDDLTSDGHPPRAAVRRPPPASCRCERARLAAKVESEAGHSSPSNEVVAPSRALPGGLTADRSGPLARTRTKDQDRHATTTNLRAVQVLLAGPAGR